MHYSIKVEFKTNSKTQAQLGDIFSEITNEHIFTDYLHPVFICENNADISAQSSRCLESLFAIRDIGKYGSKTSNYFDEINIYLSYKHRAVAKIKVELHKFEYVHWSDFLLKINDESTFNPKSKEVEPTSHLPIILKAIDQATQGESTNCKYLDLTFSNTIKNLALTA